MDEDEDWVHITTTVIQTERSRPSMVLRPDGEPYHVERRREPIGFVLRPSKPT